jgi:hypothetical protein
MTENASIKYVNVAESDPRDLILLQMSQSELLELQSIAKPLLVTTDAQATNINVDSSIEEKLESFKL